MYLFGLVAHSQLLFDVRVVALHIICILREGNLMVAGGNSISYVDRHDTQYAFACLWPFATNADEVWPVWL